MFIWETVDEKVLLVVSEHDKEYDFLSRFILHEVFVTGSEDEIHLIVISENEVELLTNALLWTPVELAKQHLILLLETVKLWGIDLLTDVEIEVESLHRKRYFLFPDVLKRWSFQKNCAGIWSFLYYRERWYFFFPKIWSYTLDGKWKMIFLKKYTEIWYFLQTFWKDGLSKKGRVGTWSFLYYLERWYFFLKMWYFFPWQKARGGLSHEIHRNMAISVCTYRCYKRGATPPCQKN